jgi:hypothetical protein
MIKVRGTACHVGTLVLLAMAARASAQEASKQNPIWGFLEKNPASVSVYDSKAPGNGLVKVPLSVQRDVLDQMAIEIADKAIVFQNSEVNGTRTCTINTIDLKERRLAGTLPLSGTCAAASRSEDSERLAVLLYTTDLTAPKKVGIVPQLRSSSRCRTRLASSSS